MIQIFIYLNILLTNVFEVLFKKFKIKNYFEKKSNTTIFNTLNHIFIKYYRFVRM